MAGDFDISDEYDVENPLYTVTDKVIITNKARSTLPDILSLVMLNDNVPLGVCAKFDIPSKTQFGPLDAPLSPYLAAKSSPFLLKSQVQKISQSREIEEDADNHLYYNTSQDKRCNWMCLVRPASNYEEQNMAAHFVKHDVFFITTRHIPPGEELRVWYSPTYARFMRKALLMSNASTTEVSVGNQSSDASIKYLRARRSRKPTNQTSDGDYLQEKDAVDVRSVPPKKRAWRRASRQVDQSPAKPTDEQNPSYGLTTMDPLTLTEAPPSHDKIVVSVLTNKQKAALIKRNFFCSFCRKSFSKKYTLKNHMTTHSSVFAFSCHICGKGFKRKDKLHQHMKGIHLAGKQAKIRKQNVVDRPRFIPKVEPKEYQKFLFKCIECCVGFNRRGMFINHLHKQHPDIDVTSIPEINLPILKEEMTYVCLHCSKSYKSNAKRKLHMIKHHPGQGLPPSKSSDSTYAASGIAKRGIRILNPVLCPYCPSQYTTKAKMHKHVSVKHPVKFAEITIFQKKKRTDKPKTPKKRSTRIPLPPLAATFSHANNSTPLLAPVVAKEANGKAGAPLPPPNAGFAQRKDSDQAPLAPPAASVVGNVRPRRGVESEELSRVSNILRMLDDVPSGTFLNEIDETTAATRQISGDQSSLENESAQLAQMSAMVEPNIVDLNEQRGFPSSSTATTSTSYQGNHSIDFMEEVTISQDGNQEVEQGSNDSNEQQQQQPSMGAAHPLHQACQGASNQRIQRQLPQTYVRGRKQLLLQAMNDEKMSKSRPRKTTQRTSPRLKGTRSRGNGSPAVTHPVVAPRGVSSAQPRYNAFTPHPNSAQPRV